MKRYIFSLIIIISTFCMTLVNAQDGKHIKLYDGKVFNCVPCDFKEEIGPTGRVTHVTEPELIGYFPEKQDSAHTAVIICPGGGYQRLAYYHEGVDVAKAFNTLGITAFVLKSRLPNDTGMTNKAFVPLSDAQAAIHLVRTHAAEWNINPSKVGICGFSAGGHLAASLSTLYNYDNHHYKDSISLRPDFSILCYAVVSMRDEVCHKGSKERLIGAKATEELTHLFSCNEQVNKNTPPALIIVASDDKTVPYKNSMLYYDALNKNNVPAELHLFQNGGHGFGLHLPKDYSWIDLAKRWLLSNRL